MAKLKTGQTRPQQFAEAVLLILFAFPAIFAALHTLDWIHRAQCPDTTFLAGSMRGDMAEWSLVVAITSLGFFALYWSEYWIQPFGALLGRHLHRSDRHTGIRRHIWAWAALALCLTALPFILAAAFSTYCLTPTEIEARSWPWSDDQHHSWRDLSVIETACARGSRGHSRIAFLLVMQDGSSLDIMDSPRNTEAAYPQLVDALRGVDFRFDSRDVDPNCGFPRVDLLMRKP